MSELLSFLSNLVTAGTTIGIVLAAIARFIPNEKLFGLGKSAGESLDNLGSKKIGKVVWEKIEDFLINSVGEFLKGFKAGLDHDENTSTNGGDSVDDIKV